MDFKDSPEDASFRAELRTWLDGRVQLKSGDEPLELLFSDSMDARDSVGEAKEWQKALYEGGWGCITWPRAYGGREATVTQSFIFQQEMSRYITPSREIYLVGLGMVGPTIIAHGTAEQKEHFVPKLADGSEIWCQLWSEPEAGSDLASLRTRAERDSSTGDWIINGQKVWTTGAHLARWGLILARTDFDLPKHEGMTCFIVAMDDPGVEVRPIKQITGGSDFNEVFFTDTRVPNRWVVGGVNQGWRVAMTTLMNERYAVGMDSTGEGMVAALVRSLYGGEGNGRMDDCMRKVVRQRIAQMAIMEKLLSLTGYRAVTRMAKDAGPGPEGSIMKLVRTRLLTDVASLGTDALGLMGVVGDSIAPEEGRWAVNFVGAPGARIGGGTDDIMKNILAERVLGLPKDPDEVRGLPFREYIRRGGDSKS